MYYFADDSGIFNILSRTANVGHWILLVFPMLRDAPVHASMSMTPLLYRKHGDS
jgi:hypothetical protein